MLQLQRYNKKINESLINSSLSYFSFVKLNTAHTCKKPEKNIKQKNTHNKN